MVKIVCCHCFFNKERAIDDIDVEYLNTFWHNSIQTAITVLCLFLNFYLMRFWGRTARICYIYAEHCRAPVFDFQFTPQQVDSEMGRKLTLSITNWELFCRLHERIFVNFLWTAAIMTKRAGTQHIKSAGENFSLYLWWNYVPALKFRNL